MGPVYLSLPREVLCAELNGLTVPKLARQRPASTSVPTAAALQEAAQLIARAERPVVITQRAGAFSPGPRSGTDGRDHAHCSRHDTPDDYVSPDGPEVVDAERKRGAGPVREFTMTATPARIDLGGHTVDTWAYGDVLPGKEIRVTAGDTLATGPSTADLIEALNAHAERLNSRLFTHRDNAIVARR